MNSKSDFLSERIRERVKEFLLILIIAIIFSFLIGIIANIIVSYSIGVTISQSVISLFIFSMIVVLLLSYFLYYFYALKPNLNIEKEIITPIFYNLSNGLIIDDPFGGRGYYPQKMAWQVFRRIAEEKPELMDKLKKGISLEKKEKFIITELLEYIIILHLSHELQGFGEKGLNPDKTIERLPKELENNTFISFFKAFKSADIVDLGMSQLEFVIPNDVVIKYWSPAPIKDRLPDPDTFKIGLTGKYCEIYIIVRSPSYWPVTSMTGGPAPVFEGVYINPYFQDALTNDLGKIIRVTFRINIKAKFKLKYILFPPKGYMDWAEKWIYRFIKGTVFSGFDFNQVQGDKISKLQYEIYETVKMSQKWIEEIEKKIRGINQGD